MSCLFDRVTDRSPFQPCCTSRATRTNPIIQILILQSVIIYLHDFEQSWALRLLYTSAMTLTALSDDTSRATRKYRFSLCLLFFPRFSSLFAESNPHGFRNSDKVAKNDIGSININNKNNSNRGARTSLTTRPLSSSMRRRESLIPRWLRPLH